MRVLQLAYRLPWPLKDGGAIGIHHLAVGYANAGVEVDLIAIRTPKHFVSDQELQTAINAYTNLHLHIVDVDTSVKPLTAFQNLFSSLPYHVSRFVDSKLEETLRKILGEKSFDVIHFDGPFLGEYINLVRTLSSAKVVMRGHNVEYRIWERMAAESTFPKRNYLSLQASRLKSYEAEMIQKMDAVLAISEVDKAVFLHMGATCPIPVVPAGVLFDNLPSPKNNPSTGTFAFLASLEWLPNIQGLDWFLESVWPLITAKNPSLTFKIAGRKMPEKYRQLNLKKVVAVGEVDNASDFLQSIDLLVVPLLSGSGIRIKILEALALGVPMVSTSVGAEGIPVVSGESILIEDQPQRFANAVLEAMNSQELRSRLIEKGREVALQKFGNDAIMNRLVEYYKDELIPS